MVYKWQGFGSGGLQSGLCEERQGCPVPDTVSSSQVQQTHCRVWLNPLENMEVPQGKHGQRRAKITTESRKVTVAVKN